MKATIKTVLSVVLSYLMVISVLPLSVLSTSAADNNLQGEGTQESPYRIYSAEDFANLLLQILPDLEPIRKLVEALVTELKNQTDGLLASAAAVSALWAARNSLPRKPQSTAMKSKPEFVAVSMSISESPTYTASFLSILKNLSAASVISGAGFLFMPGISPAA